MFFKIIAFVAAAIPIFLFVGSIFSRRKTRINEGLREFKKQARGAIFVAPFVAPGGLPIPRPSRLEIFSLFRPGSRPWVVPRSILPEPIESVGAQLGISHRVYD